MSRSYYDRWRGIVLLPDAKESTMETKLSKEDEALKNALEYFVNHPERIKSSLEVSSRKRRV